MYFSAANRKKGPTIAAHSWGGHKSFPLNLISPILLACQCDQGEIKVFINEYQINGWHCKTDRKIVQKVFIKHAT